MSVDLKDVLIELTLLEGAEQALEIFRAVFGPLTEARVGRARQAFDQGGTAAIRSGMAAHLWQKDPGSAIFYPRAEVKDAESLSPEMQGKVFLSDLKADHRAMFSNPDEGGFKAPSYAPLSSYLRKQVDPSRNAPTASGKETDRPMPHVHPEHQELMRQAAILHGDSAKWYQKQHSIVGSIFKSDAYDDTHMMLGFLAATSPRTHPHLNAVKAFRAYRDTIMGRPLPHTGAEVHNIVRAAHGIPLSGPKVHNYDKNLKGDLSVTTHDVHAKALVTNDFSSSFHPEYHPMIGQAIKQTAKQTNYEPGEAQAALWAHDIARVQNHPAFHERGSIFRDIYSKEKGGHLDPTDEFPHIQDYEQYIRHNEPALRRMKKEMDDYRLNHPVYSKMAGSGKPFLFGKDIFGGTSQQDSHPVMRYGQGANEPTRFDAIGAEHVAKALHKSDGRDHPLVDVKSRDIAHLDPETGWNMTPNVGAFSDKPTRPRKLVKHDFLGKTSSGRRPGKRQVVAGSTETPF